jgi:hypothetical protein
MRAFISRSIDDVSFETKIAKQKSAERGKTAAELVRRGTMVLLAARGAHYKLSELEKKTEVLMKQLFTTLALILAASAALATPELAVSDCKDDSIDLTSAVEMRTFGQGSINVFKTDRVEPAAAAVGLAVVVHRGDGLENYESFCKHISGLSDLDLKNAKATYSASTNTLGLTFEANMMNDDGEFPARTLTVKVVKGAREHDLVKATIR